jgi:uncharacterized hydrophobic protein (TIGR00341 family)
VLTDETSHRDPTAVVEFPLPVGVVEDVLADLREAGIDDRAYTVVLDAETVVSRNFEQLQERYAEEDKSDDRIAREEIHARAQELAPILPVFVAMTVASAVIATAGLLLDSPAVVVGSMVIALLIGPAMTTSVGSMIDDQEMFRRGAKLQVLGLVLAALAATVFAFVIRYVNLVPPTLDVLSLSQVRSRLSPDFLSLAVALGAGVAGAVSLASGMSAAIVGVMIAAALVPPIGVIGIGIAWNYPSVVLASAVLVMVNTVSINLAALAVFWYQGYRPEQWFCADDARATTIKRAGVLLAIVVLSVFLGAVTYSSFQDARAEQRIEGAIEDTVKASVSERVTLLDVQVEQTSGVVFRQPRRVVVTVGVPTAGVPRGLPNASTRASTGPPVGMSRSRSVISSSAARTDRGLRRPFVRSNGATTVARWRSSVLDPGSASREQERSQRT